MALQWQWDSKCGEAIFENKLQNKEFTINLYEGNAFLIFLNEYKEDGEDMYSVYSFFVDEAHAKNCLGLTKGNSNMFNDSHIVLKKIRLNKDRYSKVSKLVNMFIKAFDHIEIEIFSDEK